MLRKTVVLFFTWYIGRIINKDFSSFLFNRVELDESRSILLFANHFSWWDGFLMFQLNKMFLKRNFHVLVTEENHREVWFLKYLGAFPVRKGSKRMISSLEHGGKLLHDPKNLVLIFPQGKLYSNHVDEVVFQKGVMTVINSSQKNFQYLFAASFVDYFEKRKPAVACYLQTWEGAEFTSLQLIKSAYNKHYQTSRQQHSRITV